MFTNSARPGKIFRSCRSVVICCRDIETLWMKVRLYPGFWLTICSRLIFDNSCIAKSFINVLRSNSNKVSILTLFIFEAFLEWALSHWATALAVEFISCNVMFCVKDFLLDRVWWIYHSGWDAVCWATRVPSTSSKPLGILIATFNPLVALSWHA